MASFEDIFPTFLQRCAELHELLRIVAFMLFVVGTILTVLRGFSPRSITLFLVRLLVLTALLVMLPRWGNQLQSLMQTSILDGLGVDPAAVHEQYNNLLVVKRDLGPERSWWNVIGSISEFTIEKLISGLLWLFGPIASFLLFWAYVLQKVILHLGYALSPLLIGFMAIPALRHVGNRYLLNLIGVILWPLGWAVAAMVTQGILDFMTDPSFQYLDPTGAFYGLQNMLGVAVMAFWIVCSTVSAPVIIQKVFSYGALAGGQMLAGGVGSLIQTTATATSAAAVASTVGSPMMPLAAAGMAGILSSLSTAGNLGSAGAIFIAGCGLPPRGARGRPGDDITGDAQVRELIARSRGQLQ